MVNLLLVCNHHLLHAGYAVLVHGVTATLARPDGTAVAVRHRDHPR